MPQPTAFQRQRIMRNLRTQSVSKLMDISGAGAPTDGTTGAGVCGTGCTYKDTTNGVSYINTGDADATAWTIDGTQTS